MNIFYEELPNIVNIGGRDYKIITDFREWIRFSDMLKAEDLDSALKMEFARMMFLEDSPCFNEFTEVFEKFGNFLLMKDLCILNTKGGEGGSSSKQLLSYEYDAPYIFSDFLHEYGIDLLSTEYLHWWKFKILLDGLSENSQMKQRIYYRNLDINSIRDKKERARIRKIQKQIALPAAETEYVSDGDIGNAF